LVVAKEGMEPTGMAGVLSKIMCGKRFLVLWRSG